MLFAFVLYLLFTLLATGGMFWILVAHRNLPVAILGALATLLCFIALGAGVLWLLQSSGLAG